MAGTTYTTIVGDVKVFWGDFVKLADERRAIVGGIISYEIIKFLDKFVLLDNVKNHLSLCSARIITEKRPKGYK